MSTYKFLKLNDLVNFIFEAKITNNDYDLVFDSWEVTYVNITVPMGLTLSLDTKTIDSSGTNEYMLWKDVKGMVRSFLSQGIPASFSNVGWYDRITIQIGELDIRLRCPKDIKAPLDPNIQYDSFRLNFLVNTGLVIVNATTVEKILPALPEPVEAWNTYINNVFRKWEIDKAK